MRRTGHVLLTSHTGGHYVRGIPFSIPINLFRDRLSWDFVGLLLSSHRLEASWVRFVVSKSKCSKTHKAAIAWKRAGFVDIM